jgi:MFS family permease
MFGSYKAQTGILALVNVCNALTYMQISPYINQVMMDLGLVEDRNQTGYYVGIVICCGMLGRTFGCLLFGYLCDVIGRKPAISINCFFMAIISWSFGFASSFRWMLACRFLLGLLTASHCSVITMLGEAVPEHYQATAMNAFNNSFQIGTLLASLLGGFLAHPETLHLIDSGVFVEWPSLLPSLIVGLASAVVFVMVLKYIRETMVVEDLPEVEHSLQDLVATDFNLIWLLLLTLLLNFCDSAFIDLFGFWAWAKQVRGGLELSPHQYSLVLFGVGGVTCVLQYLYYNSVVNHFGLMKTYQMSIVLSGCMTLAIPFTLSLESVGLPAALLLYSAYTLTSVSMITCNFILTNHAVTFENRGKFNGISNFVACLFRAAGPLTAGSIFPWSLEVDSFPMDYRLTFLLLSGGYFLTYNTSRMLSKSLERPKTEGTLQDTLLKQS